MIHLRGYAAPFLQDETHAGRVEYFDKGAFDVALARGDKPFLNFGDHSAPPLAGTLRLFVDTYGLAFAASLPDYEWKALKPYVLTNHCFCSVAPVGEKTQRVVHNGTAMSRIYAVERIAHICITDSPVYPGTGIWLSPTHVVGDLPPRLAKLNARWEQGYANHRRAVAAAEARTRTPQHSKRNHRPQSPSAYMRGRSRLPEGIQVLIDHGLGHVVAEEIKILRRMVECTS